MSVAAVAESPFRRIAADFSASRLALVSSAGWILPGQEPFARTLAGGDGSFREIPADTGLSTLIDTHKSQSFDHEGMDRDPNLAFPLDRARELVERGRIGGLNHRHLSFMGSITAPGRLTRDHAPEAARRLVEDGVDVALLVPV